MNTLYERAAAQAGSAVDRARKRKPNNEKPQRDKADHDKITEEQIEPELPEKLPMEDDDDEYTTLPGSLGNLARELRGMIGLMSEGEMAAILQVSHETLATWRTKRRGPPHVKIGKRAFYLVTDFSQWIASEVERQAAINAPGRKHQRKRKHKPKGEPREKREDYVSDADAQGAPAIA